MTMIIFHPRTIYLLTLSSPLLRALMDVPHGSNKGDENFLCFNFINSHGLVWDGSVKNVVRYFIVIQIESTQN